MSTKTRIKGDDGDNTLQGGDLRDKIWGYGGDDALSGNAGGDTLYGGAGHDSLYGGDGQDVLVSYDKAATDGGGNLLDGGDGDDVLSGVAGDTLLGGAGVDSFGLTATDTVHYDLRGLNGGGEVQLSDGTDISGVESGVVNLNGANSFIQLGRTPVTVHGVEGATMIGGSGNDQLTDTGAATLSGLGGDDHLTAGAGSSLVGAAGDDVLTGGAGSRLSGGAGKDVFVIAAGASTAASPQVITDFDSSDLVRFDFDANTTTPGNNPFHLVDAFDGNPAELVVSYSADRDRTYVSGDVDGDKVADVVLVLKGDHHDFDQFNGAQSDASGLVV